MVTETVSGLGTSPVDIQLFNCSNVQTSSSGPTTFTGTNPGGTGNYAVQGSNGGKIIVVNGAPTNTTNNQANGVTPSNGTVTFSFTDGSQECVVPVVFQQTSNDELPLGTNNAPTVPFGVDQFTSFLPAQAAPGVITGSASSDVTSAGSNYFVQGGSTYSYGPNDTYQLYNSSTKTCATDSYSDFQQRLSQGDYVTGVYNPSATSTFCLNDVAPTAPANVYTAPPGTANTADTGSAGIEVIFSKCSTSNVTSYNVYRATAIPPTITGQPITCPRPTNAGTTNSPQTPPGSPYSKIGSVSATATQYSYTPSGGSAGTYYVYDDTTATPPSSTTPTNPEYCYVVISVGPNAAGGSQEGNPSSVAGPTAATSATTPAGTPKFASAAATAKSTTVTATYNEALTCSTVDANGSDYTLTYTVSGVTTADNPTLAACDNNGTGGVGVVTLTVPTAIPSNATVVITAKDGTDGNTVANTANPPQYQPVGDAVQTTT